MTLTKELKRGDSWVNGFMKGNFPKVVAFSKREGKAIKALETKVARSPGVDPALVGTAFDYRLRMHYETDFSKSVELLRGISRLAGVGTGLGESADGKWAAVTTELLTNVPYDDAYLPARASVVLAWLDNGYRTNRWSEGLLAIVNAIAEGQDLAVWDAYTASVDRAVADEVEEIMRAANPLPADTVRCGISFDGSRFVGGADADLLLDGCLYEVKTTERPRDQIAAHLRQLIGYALLDWNDAFALKRVGFYFSRQSAWVSWELDDLVRETAVTGANLRSLRDEFRSLAHEQRPLVRRTPSRR